MAEQDLLAELDALTPADLTRGAARKPPFVKVYNHFKARTRLSTVNRDGNNFLRLDWSEMTIIHSDTPWTGSSDSDEMRVSKRADNSDGFFLASIMALGKKLTDLQDQVVEYKLGVHAPKNADGTPRMRTTNQGGSFPVEIWYWEVVAINPTGAASNGHTVPAFTEADIARAAEAITGMDSASAMEELKRSGYDAPSMLSALIRGRHVVKNKDTELFEATQ